MISLDGESEQKISSSSVVPNDFFEDMESSWKDRVKKIHIEEEFAEVERAAEALSLAVSLQNSTLCVKIAISLLNSVQHPTDHMDPEIATLFKGCS